MSNKTSHAASRYKNGRPDAFALFERISSNF
jgi:hypothetical protein